MLNRRTLIRLGAVAGLCCIALTSGGHAQSQPPQGPRMVVELFTSQGCSSCPPADEVLTELSKQPDVIALTLPVDYWDYLGWKDTLANPAYTARQKAYSYQRGDRQVYTPQAVINGLAHAIGSKRHAIERAAMSSRSEGRVLTVPVTLIQSNGRWAVQVGAGNSTDKAQVYALAIARTCNVAIGRGENADRKMTYSNVVRTIEPLGEWTGAAKSFPIDAALSGGEGVDGVVALLQATPNGKPGAILGAAKSDGL